MTRRKQDRWKTLANSYDTNVVPYLITATLFWPKHMFSHQKNLIQPHLYYSE